MARRSGAYNSICQLEKSWEMIRLDLLIWPVLYYLCAVSTDPISCRGIQIIYVSFRLRWSRLWLLWSGQSHPPHRLTSAGQVTLLSTCLWAVVLLSHPSLKLVWRVFLRLIVPNYKLKLNLNLSSNLWLMAASVGLSCKHWQVSIGMCRHIKTDESCFWQLLFINAPNNDSQTCSHSLQTTPVPKKVWTLSNK